MAIAQQYQTKLFDSLLKPLFEKGFKRRGERGVYKIENGLVYVISFQFGRANNVYLHYFVNSLANKFTNIFHSNEFGKRLQGNEYSSRYWHIEDDSQFDDVLKSLQQSLKEIVCPFFLKINSIERLYFHYLVQFQYTLLPFSAALLSAQINENVESLKYCERSITDIKEDDEYDIRNDEADQLIYENLKELKKAVEVGGVKSLIPKWEEENKIQFNISEELV